MREKGLKLLFLLNFCFSILLFFGALYKVGCHSRFVPLFPFCCFITKNMMMKDLLFSFHICQGKNISFAYAMVFENLKKVSFNIASEASYFYILSGQKLIKNTKNGPFWRVFENLKLTVKMCYQTIDIQKSHKKWRKILALKNSSATFWVIFIP